MEIKNPGGGLPVEHKPAPDYRSAWFLPEQIVKSWFDARRDLAEKEFEKLLPIPTYTAFFNDQKHHSDVERDAALHGVESGLIQQLDELIYQFNAELLEIKLNKNIDRLKWYCESIEKLLPQAPTKTHQPRYETEP